MVSEKRWFPEMSAPLWLLWLVDFVGGILVLALAFVTVREARFLLESGETEIVRAFLWWFSVAIGIFAISRAIASVGPILLPEIGYPTAWGAIFPYTGSLNTILFIVIASLTFVFGRVQNQQRLLQTEIEARKRAESALQRHKDSLEETVEERTASLRVQRERYETLFESIRDAIVVLDTDGKITDCNPACLDIFACEQDELVGESFESLYADRQSFDDLAGTFDSVDVTTQPPEILEYERATGQTIPGETSIYNLEHRTGSSGYVGLIRDVSRREHRLNQLEVIDRVLRHNLQNDLNIIKGTAESIESSDSAINEACNTIIDVSDNLLAKAKKQRFITDLLIEPPDPKRWEPLPRIEAIVESMEETYPEATIQITAADPTPAMGAVAIDRAIEELIENAIVHSDRKAPTVTIGIETVDGAVAISIADDGPGIPQMERDVLTGRREMDPLYHGGGLGLWFVNLVVERSAG